MPERFAPQCEGAFRVGHGKEFDALEVVEIWNTVEGGFFDFGKDGQSLIAVTAHVGLSKECGWYAWFCNMVNIFNGSRYTD